jgi:hypothetical protein
LLTIASSATASLEKTNIDWSLTASWMASSLSFESGASGNFLRYDLRKKALSIETGVGLVSHFSGMVTLALKACSHSSASS